MKIMGGSWGMQMKWLGIQRSVLRLHWMLSNQKIFLRSNRAGHPDLNYQKSFMIQHLEHTLFQHRIEVYTSINLVGM